MRMRLAPLLVILSLGLALPGCGDSGEAGGGDDEFFEDDLELQSGARVLEATVRDEALVSSDEEAGEYVFDAAALASAGIEIESGNVLLIAEEALIRVTSATPRAGELVVTGDPATLPDLVDNGILAWDLELGAEGTPAPLLLIGDKLIAPKGGGLSGGSIDYSTEVDGFKISVKVTPDSNAGQLQVVIQVDRGVGGAVDFRAVATGTVRLFRHVLDMGIRGGVTENWGFATRNLEFNVEVELAGANAGTASTTLVLPGPFQLRFPIPTTLPLGLNVAVTFNLLAEVQLPALASASTQFDASFRYQGSAGFRRTGTAGFTTEGNNGATTVEISDPNTVASSGPVGFTLAFSAPRIALNALANQVTARLDNIYSMSGQLRGDPLSGLCIESGAQQSLQGTVTAGFFGIDLAEFKHTFSTKDLFKDTGDCPE
ncbi:MAG: hypothetical protein JRG93_04520 [Deltaproteobacteria bacterium]|nr:hypothetical protein [Deltaproteobacteria bacterium]MBW2402261.1 hypothetical protein [Deltaproteobacteria bacterium]MBW2547072.1 hypothetical protein [Deltaproteobacteria bacterium]